MPEPFSADELALLAAIHADPRSDLPRLVYADWLDDRGEVEHAEFIRLQCDTAARDEPWGVCEYTPRERALVRRFGAKWRRHRMPKGEQFDLFAGLSYHRFHRGLPEAHLNAWNDDFNDVRWEAVTKHLGPHYLLSVQITISYESRPIKQALSAPFLTRAYRLWLCGPSRGRGMGDAPLTAGTVLAVAPVLRQLRLLYVGFGVLTESAMLAVEREVTPHVPTVTPYPPCQYAD